MYSNHSQGDWSDTGPQARPESELNDETSASSETNNLNLCHWLYSRLLNGSAEAGGVSTRNILGRFTNLLTRWLERQITGEEEEEEEMENREEEETTTQERNASESVTETSLIPNEEPMETSQATETCEEEKRSDISASHTIDNHLEQSGVEDSSAVKEIYSNPIASPLAVSLAPKEDIKSQLQQQPTTSAKLLTSTDFQQFPMEESKSLASPGNFVVSNEAAGKEQGKSSNVKALTVPESTEINSISGSFTVLHKFSVALSSFNL